MKLVIDWDDADGRVTVYAVAFTAADGEWLYRLPLLISIPPHPDAKWSWRLRWLADFIDQHLPWVP